MQRLTLDYQPTYQRFRAKVSTAWGVRVWVQWLGPPPLHASTHPTIGGWAHLYPSTHTTQHPPKHNPENTTGLTDSSTHNTTPTHTQQEKSFTQQYSHMYTHRLRAMRPLLEAAAKAKWGGA